MSKTTQPTVVPADQVPWSDLAAVFDAADPGRCQCQRYKVVPCFWRDATQPERTAALRAQATGDHPSGLVAYVDGAPAGWVAVEPRTAYPKLLTSRIPWTGRAEDRDDPDVWAVTCFVVRKGYRGRGLTYVLARAAVEYARSQGARALEGYPMLTEPGKEIAWGELHVGARQVFEEAGFHEATHPTKRRYVMRLDFAW